MQIAKVSRQNGQGDVAARALRHVLAAMTCLFVLMLPRCAFAEEPRVFTGSVGSARIVMELEDNSGQVSGRYFYRKYRLDIGISGALAGDTLVLDARSSGDRIVLRKTRDGMVGALTTKNARQVPVRLVSAGLDDIGNTVSALGDEHLSVYERAQLSGLALVAGNRQHDGARVLRDWREPVSGIILFRIEHGYPKPVLDTINAALERHHWEQISSWFTCEGFDGAPGMDVSEQREIFLNDDFVSYSWFSNWSCAGTAHPDFGSQGFTFDAHTGQKLELEDLIYFADLPVPEDDSPEFYAYRSEVFAPRIVALLQQAYPEEMSLDESEPVDDQCNYADPSVWDFPSWHLTKGGLHLGAYFARAERPCDDPEWPVLPWKLLSWRKSALQGE